MFEDENEQNTYEKEKSYRSVKDALSSNSAVKAAIFVLGLMICIIIIYVLILGGNSGENEPNGTPTLAPGNTATATMDPNATPTPDVTQTPPVEATPTPEPFSLKRDDTDARVKQLQQLLITKGYLDASTELSEIFGPKTETAVKLFQTENGLEATGIVDNALWALIEAAPVREVPFELKKGDKDPKVIELQKLLRTKGYLSIEDADLSENFGPKTENAVKLFQKQNGLTETGIVNNTLYAMIENAAVYTGTPA